MSYGSSKWQPWVLDEAESLPLLEHAYKSGINTWDTVSSPYPDLLTTAQSMRIQRTGYVTNKRQQADVYSHGHSEKIIAKALKQYNIPRSKVVLLSKCYFGVTEDDITQPISAISTNDGEMVNQVGLSRKHIFDAVEKSVERLGTYIDVLQVHRLDRDTPREEIMKALNDVVEKGWV
jgi:aryl-alcohol dehydrogenase-like predicted oxidoreductase